MRKEYELKWFPKRFDEEKAKNHKLRKMTK